MEDINKSARKLYFSLGGLTITFACRSCVHVVLSGIGAE